MSGEALWRLDATDLVAGYRAGRFTPEQALQACLARDVATQDRLHALIWRDPDGALAAARASTRRWAQGRPLSELDGVPVTVKDNLHVQGWPTRWGSRLLPEQSRPSDELPVARLRAAGAVLWAKTHLPEFAMQGITDNLLHGACHNPWDLGCTPGGSSGGAAAAVAAGLGPLALATDGGGSIRRPAAHCGVLGFKPSAGRVPRAGGLPEIVLDHEVVGGLARSGRDLETLLGVLAGGTGALTAAAPHQGSARILVVPRFGQHPVQAGVLERLEQGAQCLQALGHELVRPASFDLAEDLNLHWPSLNGVGLAWLLDTPSAWARLGTGQPAPADLRLAGPVAQAALAAGRQGSAQSLFRLLAAIHVLQQSMRDLFDQVDYVLTPSTACVAWPLGFTHPEQIDGQAVGPRGHAVFTALANAAGLPAVSVPAGLVDGLPCGLQLIGPAGADAAVLALARQCSPLLHQGPSWPPGLEPAMDEAPA
ncbi:MAG: amidase [Curvibacter sp.]|nr:MAG: amidase [Curvibacter sp.]